MIIVIAGEAPKPAMDFSRNTLLQHKLGGLFIKIGEKGDNNVAPLHDDCLGARTAYSPNDNLFYAVLIVEVKLRRL